MFVIRAGHQDPIGYAGFRGISSLGAWRRRAVPQPWMTGCASINSSETSGSSRAHSPRPGLPGGSGLGRNLVESIPDQGTARRGDSRWSRVPSPAPRHFPHEGVAPLRRIGAPLGLHGHPGSDTSPSLRPNAPSPPPSPGPPSASISLAELLDMITPRCPSTLRLYSDSWDPAPADQGRLSAGWVCPSTPTGRG